MNSAHISEGFTGEVMHVLPRPLLEEIATNSLIGELYPTDIGWFPQALHHYRSRPSGTEQHVLIYCVDGEGWFELEGRRETLQPGQILIIPKDVRHSYGADTNNPWSIYWVHFSGIDAAWFGRILTPDSNIVPAGNDVEKRITALFHEILNTFSRGISKMGIMYASQVLRHLLAVTFFDNRAFVPGQRSEGYLQCDKIIDYMQRNLTTKMSLNKLARQAGLSVSRFSHLFKQATGVPPVEYFIRMRIQEACRLLDTTTLSGKQIAEQLGFDDPYYFSRQFKKITGLAPRHYREKMKG